MKSARFLQAVILMILIASAASCRTSRSGYPTSRYPESRRYPQYPDYPDNRYPEYPVYRDQNPYNLPPGQSKKIYGGKSARPYAPGQRKKYGYNRQFPLIIVRTPNIVIGRYNDGRYYYRSPEDLWYWKGNDDRFYLDEKFLDKAEYNDDEYREWKYRDRNNKRSEDDWRNNKHKTRNHNRDND